jgi:hypothetical protein
VVRRQQNPFSRLRVMADFGSSGIWVAEPVGPFRHSMVRHSRLGLPEDMAARFEAWIARYWHRREAAFDTAGFNAEGLELARALKQHVGAGTEVVFAREAEDGGLLTEQVVEAEPGATPDPAS